jgi:hypothetical protein
MQVLVEDADVGLGVVGVLLCKCVAGWLTLLVFYHCLSFKRFLVVGFGDWRWVFPVHICIFLSISDIVILPEEEDFVDRIYSYSSKALQLSFNVKI